MTEEEARNKGFVAEKEFREHMWKTLPNDKKFFDKIKESAHEKTKLTEQETQFYDDVFEN